MDREAQDRKEDWEGTREDPAQWSEGPKALIALTLTQCYPQASPGAHPFISNYDTYIYVAITCALGLGIVWNPSCMIPRFP